MLAFMILERRSVVLARLIALPALVIRSVQRVMRVLNYQWQVVCIYFKYNYI